MEKQRNALPATRPEAKQRSEGQSRGAISGYFLDRGYGHLQQRGFTLSLTQLTILSREVPGKNISLIPSFLSLGMSSSGMMPPPITITSSAPLSSAWPLFGTGSTPHHDYGRKRSGGINHTTQPPGEQRVARPTPLSRPQ